MADIFISYAHQDGKEAARALVRGLKSDEYEIWWDEELNPSEKFRQRIKQELDLAKAVIVIWSDNAAKSEFVCAEADAANRQGKLISTHVPAFTGTLPLPFGELHRVEVFNLDDIRRALRRLNVGTVADKPEGVRRRLSEESVAWGKIARSRSIEDFEHHIRSYPEGLHRVHAEIRLESLWGSTCKILLTSTSPRRKALLEQIGWRAGKEFFTVGVHPAGGIQRPRRTLQEAKKHVASNAINKITDRAVASALRQKALNVHQTIIVGADTVIFCDGKIFDKPLEGDRKSWSEQDRLIGKAKAREMLSCQSGRTIYIITALAMQLGSDPTLHERVVVTEAKMKSYSPQEIDTYISSCEPYDKAGAFGIQEEGIALFESISGSYTNVVGLPLREFVEMIDRLHYSRGLTFPPRRSAIPQSPDLPPFKELSAVCIGDINYDVVYDRLQPGFFSTLSAPGKKIIDQIHRGAGGTAVQFATGARFAGFKKCSVVGVVGGDNLGREIIEYLEANDIKVILREMRETSIVIILRDIDRNDTSITVTDARQALPDSVLEEAEKYIKETDVFYCSGYCLTDPARIHMAKQMMYLAKQSGHVVILDAVVNMYKNPNFSKYENLLGNLRGLNGRIFVDVFVSELPEIFAWMEVQKEKDADELTLWSRNKAHIVERLQKDFSLIILRTSNYAYEIIITPNGAEEPRETDYAALSGMQKIGYGDKRTARTCLLLLVTENCDRVEVTATL